MKDKTAQRAAGKVFWHGFLRVFGKNTGAGFWQKNHNFFACFFNIFFISA